MEPSENATDAPVHVVVTSQLIDEYIRNCEKNIRQHPDRREHYIEAPTQVLLSILQEYRSAKEHVRRIDRECLDTIFTLGNLDRPTEHAKGRITEARELRKVILSS